MVKCTLETCAQNFAHSETFSKREVHRSWVLCIYLDHEKSWNVWGTLKPKIQALKKRGQYPLDWRKKSVSSYFAPTPFQLLINRMKFVQTSMYCFPTVKLPHEEAYSCSSIWMGKFLCAIFWYAACLHCAPSSKNVMSSLFSSLAGGTTPGVQLALLREQSTCASELEVALHCLSRWMKMRSKYFDHTQSQWRRIFTCTATLPDAGSHGISCVIIFLLQNMLTFFSPCKDIAILTNFWWLDWKFLIL